MNSPSRCAVLWLLILGAGCTNQEPAGTTVPPSPGPELARVGDSVYHLGRLDALQAEAGRVFDRQEMQTLLMGWVEAQIFAQEALRRGADSSATAREDRRQARLKLLRGWLQQQVLAESLTVEDWELRNWMRDNPGELKLGQPRVRVLWFQVADSSLAAQLREDVRRDRLRQKDLGGVGISHGRSDWLTLDRFQKETAAILELLKPKELTPLLKREQDWVFYQLVSWQAADASLSLPGDEAEIRKRVLEDLQMERLAAFERRLIQEASWSLDLDSLVRFGPGEESRP
jgi:hypothetical protein